MTLRKQKKQNKKQFNAKRTASLKPHEVSENKARFWIIVISALIVAAGISISVVPEFSDFLADFRNQPRFISERDVAPFQNKVNVITTSDLAITKFNNQNSLLSKETIKDGSLTQSSSSILAYELKYNNKETSIILEQIDKNNDDYYKIEVNSAEPISFTIKFTGSEETTSISVSGRMKSVVFSRIDDENKTFIIPQIQIDTGTEVLIKFSTDSENSNWKEQIIKISHPAINKYQLNVEGLTVTASNSDVMSISYLKNTDDLIEFQDVLIPKGGFSIRWDKKDERGVILVSKSEKIIALENKI